MGAYISVMDLTTSPFKRLREMTGMSPLKFTEAAMIARTTTLYLDVGLYTATPPRALDKIIELCEERKIPYGDVLKLEYGSEDLDIATIIWQRAVRNSHAAKLIEAFEIAPDLSGDAVNPMEDLAARAFGTKDAFCKAMKIPTAVTYFYFHQDRVRPLPVVLKTALLDGGLTPADVAQLVEDVQTWRENRDALVAA